MALFPQVQWTLELRQDKQKLNSLKLSDFTQRLATNLLHESVVDVSDLSYVWTVFNLAAHCCRREETVKETEDMKSR